MVTTLCVAIHKMELESTDQMWHNLEFYNFHNQASESIVVTSMCFNFFLWSPTTNKKMQIITLSIKHQIWKLWQIQTLLIMHKTNIRFFVSKKEVDHQSSRNKYSITHVPFKTLILQSTWSISPTKFVASFHLRHLCLKASSSECLEALTSTTWRDSR